MLYYQRKVYVSGMSASYKPEKLPRCGFFSGGSKNPYQNQNSLLVTHQLTYIHQGQRMRGLSSRSHQ